jgi:uncharacterized delta-60 repeat protein
MLGSAFTSATNYTWLGELLPNGQFVPSFGAGDGTGRITACSYSAVLCNSNDYVNAVAIQPDGRYVVATGGDNELLRTTAKALALDTLESSALTVNNAGGTVTANAALAMQSSTKILAAGFGQYSSVVNKKIFGVVRLDSNLALDPSFGAMQDVQQTTFAGGAQLDISASDSEESVQRILLQPDGGIVLAGSGFDASTYYIETARFTADGLLDTTYGSNGATRLSWPQGTINNAGTALMDSAGRVVIVATATTTAFGVQGFLVARLDATGSGDIAFGDAFAGQGFSFNSNTQCQYLYADALTLDSAGRILVVGTCLAPSGTAYFALERLRGDGTLDTSFGASGFAFGAYADGNLFNVGYAIALDASGHPIVAGSTGLKTIERSGIARVTYDLIYTNNFETAPRGCLPPDCN